MGDDRIYTNIKRQKEKPCLNFIVQSGTQRKINQEIAGKRQKLTERWTDEGQKENK